ncbi:MAG: hypothetical protein LBG22_00930 [Treponema sp.]|nr:hypothetical protein [Treponema sp.]
MGKAWIDPQGLFPIHLGALVVLFDGIRKAATSSDGGSSPPAAAQTRSMTIPSKPIVFFYIPLPPSKKVTAAGTFDIDIPVHKLEKRIVS